MFEELSDGELVVLHRIVGSLSSKKFNDLIGSTPEAGKLKKMYNTNTLTLFDKLKDECKKRKINPHKLTKNAIVEVITYMDKEIDIE